MCKKLIVLALSLCLISSVGAATVNWDFENGNDHLFSFWSVYPQGNAIDDDTIAGDESLTGIGGTGGQLPEGGVAWTVGEPNQFDGQKPAVETGARVDGNGLLNYSLGTEDIPSGSSTLNTYNLNQNGDNLNVQANDQIATSPTIILEENAVLTVWSLGGGVGTHAPEYDATDPSGSLMYSDGSSGIAVISAEEDDMYAILASLHLQGQGTLTENTLDLSAFAGRRVFLDVVDSFEGSWGWLAIDGIQITNAISKNAGFVVQTTDDEASWGFDPAQIERLEMLGYNVMVVDQVEISNETFTKADANALDLLVISESPSSAATVPLAGTSTPVMHQEAYGWVREWALATRDAVNWAGGMQVEIVNDTHPIVQSAGLPSGLVDFYSSTVLGDTAWTVELVSAVAPGAEMLAQITVDGNDMAIIFAIEEGAEMADGTAAASRIVGFSLPGTQDTIPAETMTDEAWALFDAAISWLDPPPAPPTAGLVVENLNQLMGFEPQMLERLESLGYVVVLINGDDVKDGVFTMADAEALDIIVVSEAISSSDVTSLAGANVPMMNGEGFGWHKMNYAESDGSANWQDANDLVDVVNDTHPIVVNAGLSLGTMEFLLDEKAETTTASVASLAPGAESLVSMTIDGTEYALVFAIDTGAELAKGAGPATNRIVGFSLPGGRQDAGSDKNSTFVLSDDGWALFDAAIDWLDQ